MLASTPASTPVPRYRAYLPFLDQSHPPAPTPTAALTSTPIPRAASPTPTINPFETPGLVPPTPTPRPTSVPAPAPVLAPIDKVTKWGLGVYREGNEVFKDLLVAKPGVILLMDPTPGWARRVRKEFPKAFIVGRPFRNEVSQPLENPGSTGATFADLVAEQAVPLKGVVDAWMSYNEVVGHGDLAAYQRYADFQVAFARRLQDVHGVAAGAGNDGSGAVEPEDYPRYFAEAIRASAYFGVHAYSPLGSKRLRDDAGWNVLRYRKIHDELERAGIRGVRMVITESGMGDGWLGRVDDAVMADDFFWLTDELYRDPYVIGHCAYGIWGNDAMWKAFDLRGTDILTRMGYYRSPAERTPS
jgi:hypothetical protein